MMGKTHFKIGVLYYLLLGMFPAITAMLFIDYKISLVGAGAAALGALLPDADSQHSKFNYMNPLVSIPYRVIGRAERALVAGVRILLTVGAGVLVLYFAIDIVSYLSTIPVLAPWRIHITYGAATILIAAGMGNSKLIRYIPILRNIYYFFSKIISKIGNFVKKGIMIFVYAGLGAGIIIYNHLYYQDYYIYLIGGLFIGISIFPHRTFLHSLEGMVLFTTAASYVAARIGYTYLAAAFLIGYFSHLYLADIFTKEGIPLSILPFVFKKLKLHSYLHKYRVYSFLFKILNSRLNIPIMSTGTGQGALFETLYVLAIFFVSGILFLEYR